jgi:hypothetical protein
MNGRFLSAAEWQRMQARAFEIADEAMMELLRGHGLPHDDNRIGLVRDADPPERPSPVFHLADADPALIEAFDWLSKRGLAQLEADEFGEFIVLSPPAQP